MEKDPRICSICSAENNSESKKCWKCHRSLLAGSILGKQISFWRYASGWLRLICWVVAGLFCWGLVSNVIFGKMTTGQYVHKIGIDFQQRIVDGLPGPILKIVNRITNVDGGLNGLFKEYYENGQLKSEAAYKNGKREGLAKLYYKSGQLEIEGGFKDGKRDGSFRNYYENGKLKSEGVYKDGKRQGPLREYDESGNLLAP